MSGGRIAEEVVRAVEEAAIHRILAESDKQLMQRFPRLSRSSIYRIIKAARKKLHVERSMKQTSQTKI